MLGILLLLLLVFEQSSNTRTSSKEYCELDCIDDGGHKHDNIGCDIAGCAPRSYLCLEVKTDMDEFRKAMLKMHNSVRNKWAAGDDKLKPIVNMNTVSWDQDLEYLAKCWANNCPFSYNYCRRTPDFWNTGMNIAFVFRKTVTEELKTNKYPYWEKSFKQWTTIGPENISRKLEKHYVFDEDFYIRHSMSVQIIWARTNYIGCARSEYKGPYHRLAYRIVCLYGPEGNKVGRRIFRRGKKACSKCEWHQLCGTKYPNLCGEETPIFLSRSSRKPINFGLVFAILFCKNSLWS